MDSLKHKFSVEHCNDDDGVIFADAVDDDLNMALKKKRNNFFAIDSGFCFFCLFVHNLVVVRFVVDLVNFWFRFLWKKLLQPNCLSEFHKYIHEIWCMPIFMEREQEKNAFGFSPSMTMLIETKFQ